MPWPSVPLPANASKHKTNSNDSIIPAERVPKPTPQAHSAHDEDHKSEQLVSNNNNSTHAEKTYAHEYMRTKKGVYLNTNYLHT